MSPNIPSAKDKTLFTPGPLTTSRTVKTAMLRDLGSRDEEFLALVRDVRDRILQIAGTSQNNGYEAVPMQGSGTFALEAVVSSCIPPNGKLLVIVNGAYGKRLAAMGRIHGIETLTLPFSEDALPRADDVRKILTTTPDIDMVAICHCETTSGILNPIQEIGEIVRQHSATYFVDSMSAFGAVPFDLAGCSIDYLVSSSNKCIEGVPGFAFAVCRRDALLSTQGWARTLSLDLVAQWQGLESNGQFRFTPPTQVFLAFHQALQELQAEGGVAGRAERYRTNHRRLVEGMRRLGFETYVPAEHQSYIISSFHYPQHERFQFQVFYDALNTRGFVIYPGKVSGADCFRIGNIGRIYPEDIDLLLDAMASVLRELDIDLTPANRSGGQP